MKHLLYLILPILISSNIQAQNRESCAVLKLSGIGITEKALYAFKNRINNELILLNKYQVIPQNIIDSTSQKILQNTETEFSKKNALAIGKELNSDYLLFGSVDKLGTAISISLTLLNSENHQIENLIIEDCINCSIEQVLTKKLKIALLRLLKMEIETEILNEEEYLINKSLKNPYLGCILSVIPGAGHFYAQKPGWALAHLGLRSLGFAMSWMAGSEYTSDKQRQKTALYVSGSLMMVDMIHAYLSVLNYNDFKREKSQFSLIPEFRNNYNGLSINLRF